ncbi:universal stress protein [Rhizobium sp. BK538]|uniref:universal stress protein n=1 Tax=Rhizobium sp. BK538 TaxID=2586984 RepID=UPI00160E0369|nr:universal stress protein [Rhizobium sp. BK538]MBB4169283.1 nucleotide-binding universal stress UspA family protein [Rhizobium sp. BK538]
MPRNSVAVLHCRCGPIGCGPALSARLADRRSRHHARLIGVDVSTKEALKGESRDLALAIEDEFKAAAQKAGLDYQYHAARPEAHSAEQFFSHCADLLVTTQHGVGVALEGWRNTGDNDFTSALFAGLDRESADLIVCGAYGHSPLFEDMFGGATRDLLKNVSMPVLMSH